MARAPWVELGGVQAPLSRSEDLIVMQAVAYRPQDLTDIEAILAARPKLNLRQVRRGVREFSAGPWRVLALNPITSYPQE